MALTESTMLSLGTDAPGFTLPDTDGNSVSLDDLTDGEALAVIFLCNHCPYVIHVQKELAAVAEAYEARGIRFVGINSNDVESYPDDSPERMREEKERIGYTFPYLFDESQEVARAYRAACTPDIYLFDRDQKLVYRGQFDSSRPNSGTPTGENLIAAMDALLAGEPVPEEQVPGIGCNIKWKPGNAPDYFSL
ncbi:thioredoxin family protein [Gemmatimonadota bacterium]